jgi:hypothetical protein
MIRPRRLIALSLLLSAVSGVIAVAAVLVARSKPCAGQAGSFSSVPGGGMIVMGLAIMTGRLSDFSFWFPVFSTIG